MQYIISSQVKELERPEIRKVFISRLHELAEVVRDISNSEMNETVWKAHLNKDSSAKDTLVQHANRFTNISKEMWRGEPLRKFGLFP